MVNPDEQSNPFPLWESMPALLHYHYTTHSRIPSTHGATAQPNTIQPVLISHPSPHVTCCHS